MKKKEILILFLVWYPFAGFILAWLNAFYQFTILKGHNIEQYSIERINYALSNMMLNIFRVFDFNLSSIFDNVNHNENISDLSAAILFFSGLMILPIANYSTKLIQKRNYKVNSPNYNLLLTIFIIIFVIVYGGWASPMIFEGYIFSFVFFIFYQINNHLQTNFVKERIASENLQ